MRSRLARRFHIVALILALGLFIAAEILRSSHTRNATLLSMIAWSLFLGAFLKWAWLGRGWRSGLGDISRIAILTAVAGTVLRLYFVRSGSIEAGVHVDAAYSYIGAGWFAGLRSPITFVAPNPS